MHRRAYLCHSRNDKATSSDRSKEKRKSWNFTFNSFKTLGSIKAFHFCSIRQKSVKTWRRLRDGYIKDRTRQSQTKKFKNPFDPEQHQQHPIKYHLVSPRTGHLVWESEADLRSKILSFNILRSKFDRNLKLWKKKEKILFYQKQTFFIQTKLKFRSKVKPFDTFKAQKITNLDSHDGWNISKSVGFYMFFC